MKKRLISLLMVGTIVMMFMGCGADKADTTPSETVETETTETVEDTEPEIPEEDTEQIAESGVPYVNEELGFEVELPALLQDKMSVTTEEREAYEEIITTVIVYYEGTEGEANVLSFEEMSKEVWDKVQAEGGPVGKELGVSEEGRVVVLNTIQSNPYKEGSEDFEVLQNLPKQLGIVEETFAFLEK